ncbi:hypothetical protein KY284_011069 [Solanum tuberosum]|nr:hypothetical protein KY284_011069 [Solanum tuberosum]
MDKLLSQKVEVEVTKGVQATMEEECMHLAGVESEWMVETTTSYHATLIMGIRDICIKTNVGCTLVLKNVCHVPDLLMNLISGVALDRDGYENYFANKKWRLTKVVLVITKGVAHGMLYRTNTEICQSELNVAHEEISTNLWHRRMGHMSEK